MMSMTPRPPRTEEENKKIIADCEEKERVRMKEMIEKTSRNLEQSSRIMQNQLQRQQQMRIDAHVEAMRIIEAEKLAKQGNDNQQVNVDVGNHAETAPTLLNQNSNNSDFSGLLNNPSKKDDWFLVIDDMTRGFHAKFGKIPNETQAWGALWKNPPEGYEITTGKDRGDDCLIMPGITNLSKRAFNERWKKYTAPIQDKAF